MSTITDVDDLRAAAKRRLPGFIFDYLERGAYQEETLRRNTSDLHKIQLRAKVLNDVSMRSTATTLLGTDVSFPAVIAPMGAEGIFSPNGEIHAAIAARDAGIPFCLSTLSIDSMEDVAKAANAPFWFQLYLTKDRGVSASLIDRAKAAGCSALVLSMDVHVRSRRHSEVKGGLTAPPKPNFTNVIETLFKPWWGLGMLHSKHWTFGNLKSEVKECRNIFTATEWLENQWDPSLSTKDVEWVRNRWGGKFVVKGVLHPDDARTLADMGVDAVSVSNHGGRQVDGAASTTAMLPSIVNAVNGRSQVFVDSGVRTGIDILKMLALGADACLIGRPIGYALGARGQEGVEMALCFLKGELDETMALCGITSVHDLPPDLAIIPEGQLTTSPFYTS
ncbi:MAG TPA: alpha-hydroxy acid oxidase [Fimbriimonadaceae bacterium]|jgi:L-lactate dehydrogenase (cytochrome)